MEWIFQIHSKLNQDKKLEENCQDCKLLMKVAKLQSFARDKQFEKMETELVEFYGFDGLNLAAYGGWTISTSQAMFGVRTQRVYSRYLCLHWQGYFDKLLKHRG